MLSPSHFPAKLKAARTQARLTQMELARTIPGCTQGMLSRMEKGEHGLTLETFTKVCNALKLSADSMLQE